MWAIRDHRCFGIWGLRGCCTWCPRDESQEADALANQVFEAFAPARRVAVVWSELEFFVLPQLTKLAGEYFQEVQDRKRMAKDHAATGPPRKSTKAKGTLRELDPW